MVQKSSIYKDLSDNNLMALCQSGDCLPFEEIVTRYQNPMIRFLSSYAGFDQEHVLDMAQEVFLKAYRFRLRYKPKYAFSTWLYSIAINVVRDFYKSHQKKKHLVTHQMAMSHIINSQQLNLVEPAEILERQELRSRIQLCINELSEKYRLAILLRDIEGLSYKEVAIIMKLSLSATKVRVNRARLQFKEIYKQRFLISGDHDD